MKYIRKIISILSNKIPTRELCNKKELIKLLNKIPKLNKKQLTDWLRFEAGSENPINFKCELGGGMELQQIPEEYAEYLLYLKNKKIENYLQIGIGTGSSFFIESSFIAKDSNKIIAVDNTSYNNFGNQKDKITDKINILKELYPDKTIEFHNINSSEFFRSNKDKFDLIFIDGDHSYQGVKLDYEEALKCTKVGGSIIFHDIASIYCPGVMKLWKEIGTDNKKEIIYSNQCGIGIIEIQ